jgi:hypothetical protein
MAFNYASIRKQVLSIISTFGQAATLRHQTTVVDPVTGLAVPTIADTAVITVISDAKADPGDPNFVEGDKRALLGVTEGRTIDPTRDRLIVQDAIYKIVSVSEVSPGGLGLLWDMKVRRGE